MIHKIIPITNVARTRLCTFPQKNMLPFIKQMLNKEYRPSHPRVVIMVGYPGSGKTTTAETNFGQDKDFVILHNDVLKTVSASKKALREILSMNKSAVIDDTNPSKKKRAIFVKIAKEFKLPISVLELNTSFEESFARNMNRNKKVHRITYYVYRKYYEKPTTQEGFSEIITFF